MAAVVTPSNRVAPVDGTTSWTCPGSGGFATDENGAVKFAAGKAEHKLDNAWKMLEGET
jgi:hypothetical protein